MELPIQSLNLSGSSQKICQQSYRDYRGSRERKNEQRIIPIYIAIIEDLTLTFFFPNVFEPSNYLVFQFCILKLLMIYEKKKLNKFDEHT